MRAELNQIDSEAAGRNVVDILDYSAAEDFASFERQVVQPLKPGVVFCKMDAGDVPSIQKLEQHEFRFADYQLSLRYRMRQPPEPKPYPYHWERVTNQEDLGAALELAGKIFEHDRFSRDPEFGPGVAGKRYRAYVQKSYRAADERVYVMKTDDTARVVSFGTIRLLNSTEARLLIGGVATELKQSGMGVIHDYVGLKTYYSEGIRVLHTVVSGTNYPIMNLEIGHLGFRITGCQVVLKKRYA